MNKNAAAKPLPTSVKVLSYLIFVLARIVKIVAGVDDVLKLEAEEETVKLIWTVSGNTAKEACELIYQKVNNTTPGITGKPTVDTFKAWLSYHPVTLQYVLSEPVKTVLTGDWCNQLLRLIVMT